MRLNRESAPQSDCSADCADVSVAIVVGLAARSSLLDAQAETATTMMTDLGYSSKLNAEREFLYMLREEGRRTAGAFLDAHVDDLGHRPTDDLDILLAEY